ncbi:MAG: ArsR family transcriptional regulator [Thermoplasmatales archaeon]|jgi:predicted DNA-binding ArsR family transcriptional regulator|nr:ArsR family transcriptional regulator [Candidatus Thermoplasmatota archaeon]MCL6003520.1 ArsR family transcriptional regulator [Candidatus Thermoplasmatota archaeon]MDA8055991.1 ArsR family transcriptional regulator [Thermoplasmatales archaeon]
MNKIKVVNDVGDLVTIFTISNDRTKSELLKLLNQNWMTEDEVKQKLGAKAVEFLKYMEKIKFVESQWSNTANGPKKVFHNYYTSIQINILLPTEEAGDIIYVASLDDSEVETYCNKITKMMDDGTQYIAEIQEKLKQSPTYVRAIIKRSKHLTIKGMKVEKVA